MITKDQRDRLMRLINEYGTAECRYGMTFPDTSRQTTDDAYRALLDLVYDELYMGKPAREEATT